MQKKGENNTVIYLRLIFVLKKEDVCIRTANKHRTHNISGFYIFFLYHSVSPKSARSQGTYKVMYFFLSPEENLAFFFLDYLV